MEPLIYTNLLGRKIRLVPPDQEGKTAEIVVVGHYTSGIWMIAAWEDGRMSQHAFNSVYLVTDAPKERTPAEVMIADALDVATNGTFDGSHHKMWVIDQMVRTLTGCPTVKRHSKPSPGGVSYEYDALGESEAYLEWVRKLCDGVDGPNTYAWDTGIAP